MFNIFSLVNPDPSIKFVSKFQPGVVHVIKEII